MSILKGTIYITHNEQIVYQTPLNSNTRIISLDEDDILVKNDAILVGSCLLPPIEARIAEVDGNEALYDNIYSEYLLEPYQQNFIAAMISFLYRGGNFIIFLPDNSTSTRDKLVYMLYKLYGIHCGHIEATTPDRANCYYDDRCIPIWLNLIYSVGVISPYEYLYQYPIDAVIQNNVVISKLVDDLNPYGDTIDAQVNYIFNLHKKIHINPNIRQAISSIRRN